MIVSHLSFWFLYLCYFTWLWTIGPLAFFKFPDVIFSFSWWLFERTKGGLALNNAGFLPCIALQVSDHGIPSTPLCPTMIPAWTWHRPENAIWDLLWYLTRIDNIQYEDGWWMGDWICLFSFLTFDISGWFYIAAKKFRRFRRRRIGHGAGSSRKGPIDTTAKGQG